jgi:SET domain-containing protein
MSRPYVIQRHSAIHGYGVFANRIIHAGEVLWAQSERHYPSHYELKDIPIELRERSLMWGNLRYVYYLNHSCDPNTAWSVDGALLAQRDISVDEEITYDYSSAEVGYEWVSDWTCECGAPTCRGRISSSDILRPEVYERYRGRLPGWVEEYVKRVS